ncbi:MAG: NifU family protein [Burkholderiales bacterium]
MTKLPFVPDRLDAPFYTDEELDALEAVDPVAATRIAREQAQLQRQLALPVASSGGAKPDIAAVEAVIAEARRILARDGGDIEFVALEGSELSVRLKGSCAGCPRAPLDLKHVVEELVRRRYPQITAVRNVF